MLLSFKKVNKVNNSQEFVEYVATLLVSVIAWMAVSFVVSAYVEASCVLLSTYYVGESCHG